MLADARLERAGKLADAGSGARHEAQCVAPLSTEYSTRSLASKRTASIVSVEHLRAEPIPVRALA